MYNEKLIKKSVLRVGEVIEVSGRKIFIVIDKNKNTSDLLFNGEIVKNISVGSYIEIQKGFLSLIGKIDGEKIIEDTQQIYSANKIKRVIEISLIGYIDNGKFFGGTKEMPLIGNEAFIVTKEKNNIIHDLVDNKELFITIGNSDFDDANIKFPVDKLFNSHIAIFGNTGSGKSNTLASLYQHFIEKIKDIKENTKFVLFDFNGEYVSKSCITKDKFIYELSTDDNVSSEVKSGENETNISKSIVLKEEDLLNIEIFSILADATEKTQKPFLVRAINSYKKLTKQSNPDEYLKHALREILTIILTRKDETNSILIDFIISILPQNLNSITNMPSSLTQDITLSYGKYIFINDINKNDAKITSETAKNSILYNHINTLKFIEYNVFDRLLFVLKFQMINDIQNNRAQKDHIYPVINRLERLNDDLNKIIKFDNNTKINFWQKPFIIVNLKNVVNINIKKMIPLILAKKLYSEHKKDYANKILTIIIDEAHNILSSESFREAEDWKDFRLETFEEIIKEGRKFGVFLTIASQRPNDISDTIISQAHNYFIHRLINYKDLNTISSAVSYIDKLTSESIPTLPVGTCIFSGIATQLPLKINVFKLPDECEPKSKTIEFADLYKDLISSEGESEL